MRAGECSIEICFKITISTSSVTTRNQISKTLAAGVGVTRELRAQLLGASSSNFRSQDVNGIVWQNMHPDISFPSEIFVSCGPFKNAMEISEYEFRHKFQFAMSFYLGRERFCVLSGAS